MGTLFATRAPNGQFHSIGKTAPLAIAVLLQTINDGVTKPAPNYWQKLRKVGWACVPVIITERPA